MKEPFDPYRKWLGIPPQDQPPHHYRLLGIEPFESDPDVISTAVDGRMALIKNFQSGKHSVESQQILNEIAAAKVCLLNSEKKEEYDRQLRHRLKETRKRPPKAAPAGPPKRETEADPKVSPSAVIPQIDTSAASTSMSHRASKRSPQQVYLLLAAAGAIVVGLLVFLLTRGNDASAGPSTASKSSNEERPGDVSVAEKTRRGQRVEPPPEPPLDPPAVPPVDPSVHPPVNPPVVPPVEPPVAPVDPPEDHPGRPLSELLNPPDSGDKQPGDPNAEGPGPAEKVPVPELEAQQEAEQRIREIYKSELAAATTPDGKLDLVEDLMAQAGQAATTATNRFVLLKLAFRLATEAGDLAKVLEIADGMCGQYELNTLGVRTHAIKSVVESIRPGQPTKAESGQIVDTALRLVDEALRADDFRLALDLVNAATDAVAEERDLSVRRELAARTTERGKEVRRLKLNFDNDVAPALALLAENPDDPAANETAGRWYCFSVDHWSKGLPLLAKGADAELAALAQRDAAGSDDPMQQKALGDAWWDLAQGERGPQGQAMRARVIYWYRWAESGLDGLAKKEVQNRLRELEPDATPGVAEDRPSGNVALASNGTKVTGTINRAEFLLDGSLECTNHSGFAWAKCPAEWTVTFDKPYPLREIRIHLWNLTGDRLYRYAVLASADGRKFSPLADRSVGAWTNRQDIPFAERKVKAIKLLWLGENKKNTAHVIEFEAYCIPPDRAAK